MKLGSREMLSLLDDAYDVQLDEAAWSDQLIARVVKLTDAVSARMFRIHMSLQPDGSRVWAAAGDVRSTNVEVTWTGLRSAGVLTEEYASRAFGYTMGGLFAVRMGLGSAGAAETPGFVECWHPGVRDAFGLISHDAQGDILALTTGLTDVHGIDVRTERFLAKIAMHIGTADRLRRRNAPSLDRAEAILDAKGAIVHVNDPRPETRAALDDGVGRRAFAHENRDAPERALDVWQGLVAGRWSLVDFFDTDGKRFVLAMKNPPKVDRRADLTPRERRVAALVAMGHRDKEIAYTLGLSIAAVSTALRRARLKLGVENRAELAAAWRQPG